MARSVTHSVPATTRELDVYLDLIRTSGKNTYNDAYADNLAMQLSPAGGPAPQVAKCAAPPSSGEPGSPAGTNSAVPLSRVGKRLTFRGRFALIKLHCSAPDASCKGVLALTAKSLPRVHKSAATKLGSSKFTIAAGKTKTIKVKLKRSVRRRIKALSAKRVRKLKITATARLAARPPSSHSAPHAGTARRTWATSRPRPSGA